MKMKYYKYWGKANGKYNQAGEPYHLLPYHCLDVAAVGYWLLAPDKPLTKALAEFLGLAQESLRNLVVFTLALHDIGKFASSFQGLYSHGSDRLLQPKSRYAYDGKDYRHDTLGGFFWRKLIQENRFFLPCLENVEINKRKKIFKSLNVVLECVLGHHGKPIQNKKNIEIQEFTEPENLDAVDDFVQSLYELFMPEVPVELFADKQWRKRLEQVSWHLAGLAVLADWIGSDDTYFPYKAEPQRLVDYWNESIENAKRAITDSGIAKPVTVKPFLSIEEHFQFSPTPLQQWAESVPVDDSPQLFILEDVTGSGKTEAALALTHRLMEAGAADGFYFGLPTMATSNAMFSRIADNYLQMMASDNGAPSIVLAHGSRDMNDRFRDAVLIPQREERNYAPEDSTATAQCARWLADSRKKALLAPVGVGTIDQPLLAVLPRRHQSLRLLGLHRKVLIFDEVHAADEYMLELLESLLALHLHQGGSVILLTATLSQQQRQKLCAIWQTAAEMHAIVPSCRQFPLATKVAPFTEESLQETPLESRATVSRKVIVRFLHQFDDCVDKVLEAVAQGQCVVWVRNSVDDAIEAFEHVREHMENPEHCLLFHSRFILKDRKDLEYRVLDIFGKDQQNAEKRRGRVLVATQVFQESLDADADVMISDLCPIDDLIQRAGRLHRHTRDEDGIYSENITDTRNPPEIFLFAPEWTKNPENDWLSRDFRNTQFVYRSAGRLWLGMRKLKKLGVIRMPEDARELIESVYSEEALAQIPERLIEQEDTYFGEQRSKAAKARFQLLSWDKGYCIKSTTSENDWGEDESEISTRYSDIETVEVLLVKESAEGELLPWTGNLRFAVELSTVKIGKNRYADKLAPIPQHLEKAEEELKNRYIRAKYLRCWLPEHDPNFAYDPMMGFYERNPR